ncbi:MAG: peptidase, partial [Anaerococcus vaginalis]
IKKAPVNEGETGAGEEETGTDKEETGTDKEETGTDKEETGADKEETGTDKEETGTDKEETGTDKEETGADKEETGADKEETPDNKTENSETDEEKPKDEKKVKPREFKMSEVLNEKTFEFIKNDTIKALNEPLDIYTNEEIEEFKRKANLVREAKSIDEIIKITGWKKEQLAKNYLYKKGIINYDEDSSDLIKIIDDTMNPSQKNPNRKNKKTGTTNTANTGNKVNNAGENVQTGVGSLSAILGLLGASSLGLFKSKRK